MSSKSVATPDNQGVTWVELFFDLIFVFSITRLVGLMHHGFTWLAVGQVAMAFWFVWFAWGQFTWALNAANTRHNKDSTIHACGRGRCLRHGGDYPGCVPRSGFPIRSLLCWSATDGHFDIHCRFMA